MLEDVGTWKRARCFPRNNETIDAAVARESLAVRTQAGMLDASTLGKIEIAGPDAATFLTRIYTGDFTRLAPGRCRYAVLLGEAGFICDDGIVAASPPIVSMSPRPPAAPPSCSTTWRTICRPSSPTSASG